MRVSPFLIPVAAVWLTACATFPGADPAAHAILADAKTRSASYCSEVPDGCEYSVSRTSDGGFGVHVVPIHRDEKGVRFYGIDLDEFYVYDRRGQFVNALRGH